MAVKPPNRFQTQNKLVVVPSLRHEKVTILGAGGVGRQIALQLVALGVRQLTVVDPALVEHRHLTSQGYRADDVGKPKVDCVGDVCHQTEPLLDFTGVQDTIRSTMPVGTSVFCCLDDCAARKRIWRSAERQCHFWCDVRLEGETVRILTADDEPAKRRYATTLSTKRSKRRSTTSPLVCVANMAASLAVWQFTRYLRELPLQRDVTLDPAAGRYGVADDA